MSKKINGEGTIVKRKDGLFMGQLTIGRNYSGKIVRKTVYAKTKSEVVKKMNDLKGQIFSGVMTNSTSLTLSEWLEQWLCTYKKFNRTQTKSTYKMLIHKNINPKIGNQKLCELKNFHLQSFINSLSPKYSTGTIQKIKNILNNSFNLALSNQLITVNPIQNVQLPAKNEKEVIAFTEDEQIKFEKASENNPLNNLFILLLKTGLRIGEALCLTWSDIDFEKCEISVSKTLVREENEIGKEILIVQDMPKTKSSSRMVSLNQTCLKILNSMFVIRTSEKIFHTSNDTYIYPRNVQRFLENICAKAGIKHASPHILRNHNF